MATELRCLAIRQPWAWAITAGAKDIENRSWTTDHRGPVVIQASSAKTAVNGLVKANNLRPLDFAYGALIGVADLVDVVPLSQELEANPWAWGPHCWIFRNARAFREPIPCKGKLNLYTLAPDVAAKARAAIKAAVGIEHDANVRIWLEAMLRADAEERQAAHFESYIELDDGPNAIRLATARVESARSTDTLTDLARARLAADDVPGALVTATEAIEANNENARALFVRSLIYGMLSDDDRLRAAEIDPAFADQMASAEEEEDAAE